MSRPAPDRNLALSLVRVSEAAAMATGRWVGRNDPHRAFTAAAAAVRTMIDTVEMTGTVLVDAGYDSSDLSRGTTVGDGTGAAYDIAVDPVAGTVLTAKGLMNAVSTLAVAPRGAMWDTSSVQGSMDVLVAGREAHGHLDIRSPVGENVARLATATARRPEDVTVGMLARPSHEQLADEVRASGARVCFLTGPAISAAVLAAGPRTGIDLLVGSSAPADTVMAACATKCQGGTLQAMPRSSGPGTCPTRSPGLDGSAVLDLDDLVRGDDAFFVLTGITDGPLVRGVRYEPDQALTESLVMRARSGTVRRMQSDHRLDRLDRYSAIDYRS